MNKLKFTNVTEDKATINLYGSIGGEVNGNYIAEDILYINKHCPNINEIEIKINSMGGDVLDGLSVCTEILNSEISVTTVITGMAYSIAGVIAMCGHNRKMTDYGTFMMHDVSGGNGNNDVLDLLSNSLAKIFEGTTPLTLENTRELMDVETWMSPEQCLEKGLINEIIPTTIKRPAVKNDAELYKFYNKLLIKKDEMLKIKNELSLEDNASEELIVERVQELKNEADVAKSEKDAIEVELKDKKQELHDLENKLKSFEEAEQAKEEAAKLEVIENAVKDNKIKEESKESFIDSPMKSDELKNMFDGIKTVAEFAPVSDELKAKNSERADWDYSKWEKEDSKGLMDLKNNAPAEFERLVATIGKSTNSKL